MQAIPSIYISQTSGFANFGFVTDKYQPAGLQQNENWTVPSQFIEAIDQNEQGELVITVNPDAYKAAVLRLAEQNITHAVALIKKAAMQ